MKIKFLGTTGCIPDKNDDSPSYVINGKYCIDCGWALVTNLLNNGYNPVDIKYVIFTHMHHDHYLSLPTLLFYYLQTGADLSTLTILGPDGEVEDIVNRAMSFLKTECFYKSSKFPIIRNVKPGDIIETEDAIITTAAALHDVPALYYKITEKSSGKTFATTGDTTYKDDSGEFFFGADVLIHETTLGLYKKEKENEIPSTHSSIYDAVRTANEANIKRLFIMHGTRKYQDEIIEEGKKFFDGELVWPEIGKEYEI